jgi:hypothetical protein
MMLMRYSEVFCNRLSSRIKKWQNHSLEIKKYPELLPTKNKDQLTKFFEQYIREVTTVLK